MRPVLIFVLGVLMTAGVTLVVLAFAGGSPFAPLPPAPVASPATLDLTIVGPPASTQDPAIHAYYVAAAAALTPTATAVPPATDTPLPAQPVCEQLAQTGGSGPCQWAMIVTPVPVVTYPPCQTPIPGDSCEMAAPSPTPPLAPTERALPEFTP